MEAIENSDTESQSTYSTITTQTANNERSFSFRKDLTGNPSWVEVRQLARSYQEGGDSLVCFCRQESPDFEAACTDPFFPDLVAATKTIATEEEVTLRGRYGVSDEGGLVFNTGSVYIPLFSSEEDWPKVWPQQDFIRETWEDICKRNTISGNNPWPTVELPEQDLSMDVEKTVRKRGVSVKLRPDVQISAGPAARALTHGILAIPNAKLVHGVAIVSHPQSELNFKLAAEESDLLNEPRTLMAVTRMMCSKTGVLSLKALYGALEHWAQETGAVRFDQYIEATMYKIMRQGGFSSQVNDKLTRKWLQAFLPLVQSFVEVPETQAGKATGVKTFQRVLASDQLTLTPSVFSDEADQSQPILHSVRYHPGEWLFNSLFGKEGKQFYSMSRKLVEYDANRHTWHLKIGFYIAPFFNINRKGKNVVVQSAEKIRDGAFLTYNPNQAGRFIDTLERTLRDLEKDKVFGQVDIRDPGKKLSPAQRLEGLVIAIHPPDIPK